MPAGKVWVSSLGWVMIDLTPRALLHRLQRGVVYEREKADRARENFFRESTLAALRELALRQTTQRFVRRIEEAERLAAEQGEEWTALDLEAQDRYYAQAKAGP